MKKDKEKIFQLSYLVFLNNIRGLNIIKLFSKKKMNFEAVITTKNLNKKILQDLKKLKVRHIIIKNCKNLKENLKKKYDVFVVAGFPHIFNQETLNLPKFGSINLHAGPLPKYRGGSPLNWQIINHELNRKPRKQAKPDVPIECCSNFFADIAENVISSLPLVAENSSDLLDSSPPSSNSFSLNNISLVVARL